VADQHGDHALVSLLDDLPPKDLLAIMREFDSSKESIVNMLVTPEQFAHSIVLERQYGERTSERLRAMVNAVIHRDENTVSEYLDAIVNLEGGIETLADYFEDRYDEMLSFATSGRFAPEYEQDAGIQVHTTWLMEKLESWMKVWALATSSKTRGRCCRARKWPMATGWKRPGSCAMNFPMRSRS